MLALVEIAEKSNFLHLLQSWATSIFSFLFYSKYVFKLKRPAYKFLANTNLNVVKLKGSILKLGLIFRMFT